MLSIGKLGTGQGMYYLEKVAEGAEDYYSGEGETPGRWTGDAAAELGLSGEVEADQLTGMLTGHGPASGEPLGLRAVGGRGPVPGFDLTFSAPKSVSLLWGLGGPIAGVEVNQAHRAAVDAALNYLQREACWTRRGAGGAEFVEGNGYLAAAFEHRSSRNGDPQLHTHVLIANATQGPDGRWTRLYHPAIYEHAQTASYLYQAQLRHELTHRLGVEWQEVRKGIAEIEGFADEHLREFSTRRAEIVEAVGPDASARSMEVAALTTRQAKEQDLSRQELHERWRSRGEEIGLDAETISRAFDPEAIYDPAPAEADGVTHEQIGEALTAHASHFDRREAIQAVAQSQRSGAPAAEVQEAADRFLESDQVLRVSESARGERFTTQRIWELERSALATAERMQGDPRGQAGELIAARVTQARPTLKADQREMVRRLLADPEGIAVVVGEAGTGKTFAIVAAAEGWAQAGYELRAVAPTWRAANVLRAKGLEATSVARLLVDMHGGDADSATLSEHTVLLVDEAGMVGSAELAALIEAADAAGAKLVLIGDHQQLGEIEAGGLYRALAERADPIVLDEVIRHSHDLDREAARMIREGEGRAALELYRSSERVTVAPDAEARREAMVADWHRAYSEGQDALMVAKRNSEVERLNATARELLRAEGALGQQEIEVGEARFAAGDRVITRVNDHSNAIYNRERWQVAEVDLEQRRVVLEGIDQQRTVEIGPDYLSRTTSHGEAPALQHAYAVTTYSAQGATVDRAYVMADPSMDKQEIYVAASTQSRGDLPLRHARDPGRARRVRAETARARRDRPRRRSGAARSCPERRPRRGAARRASQAAQRGAPRKARDAPRGRLPGVQCRPAPRRGAADAGVRAEALRQRRAPPRSGRRSRLARAQARAARHALSASIRRSMSCGYARRCGTAGDRRATRHGGSARSPARSWSSAASPRFSPPSFPRLPTSSTSWANGPPIPRRPRRGTGRAEHRDIPARVRDRGQRQRPRGQVARAAGIASPKTAPAM